MDLMVVAGEASGDLHAAALIEELRRRRPGLRVAGCGGAHMQAAGCELLVSASELAMVGLFEVVAHLPRVYGLYRRLLRAMRERRPAAVILVDFPDFNFRLAAAAHRVGIRTIYFISPQLWAWREGRVRQVRRDIGRMICIFPFEQAFYARHGINVAYVGHPLVERLQAARSTLPDRTEFARHHGLDTAADWIALLPGSRRREVEFHLPTLLEAAAQLHAQAHVQFVVPVAPTLDAEAVRTAIPPQHRDWIRVVANSTYAALSHARLALVASGTATVETALLGTPMVVVYRLSPWTWRLGRRWVRSPHFAMVNLIAGRRIVPELMQSEFTAEAVVNWAIRLLPEGAERTQMVAGLQEVRQRLGEPGAISRAADEVEAVLGRQG